MTRARVFLPCLLLGLLPGRAFGQQCAEDVLCVHTEERSNTVYFYVDNLIDDELIVIFQVESENMNANVRFPHMGVYPGKRETLAFTLSPRNRRARWRYSYAFRWRRSMNQLGCREGIYCLEVEEHDRYIEVYVENQKPFDITIKLDLNTDHAVAEVEMPYTATFPGNRRTRAFRLRRTDPSEAVQYKYSHQWLTGNLNARHDDTFVYALPYAVGKAFAVVQGFNGSFSHHGKHAIDWDMPERTPVHAARGGLIVEVEVGYTEGGLDAHLKTRANRILIQHDDGTLGNYVHLAPNGAFVTVGQRVAQGQVIGVSGNTGYSSGPHLHFEVYTIDASFRLHTIPIRFRVEGGAKAGLKEGQAYTAPLR